MEWIRRSGLTLGIFPALEAHAPALRVWFTSRLGGVSPPPYDSLNLGETGADTNANVATNRKMLLDALGLSPESVARGVQVHDSLIRNVTEGGVNPGPDGLITGGKNLALAIATADCYPIALYAPPERALAALHVGRGGAAQGIITAALDAMEQLYHINRKETLAIIGPGICARCYTVGTEIAAHFPAAYVRRRGGLSRLDLLAHCTDRLLDGGLRRRNIHRAGLCTACNAGLFYSYRRDGVETGRHWMLAMIVDSP